MGLKELVLQKGWAGKTISRAQTAERVNELIRPLIDLMHLYNGSLSASGSNSGVSDMQRAMPVLRADIGKLTETVHSCGAVAYSGTDLSASSYSVQESHWAAVLEREIAYASVVSDEKAIEHQMRTRAILANVVANSDHRQELVNQILKGEMTKDVTARR